MCFDGQTLSAYVDGELDNSQQLIIKNHLQECSRCRNNTDVFKSIDNQLKSTDQEVDLFRKEAVWTRLAHSTSSSTGLDFWHKGFVISPSFMLSFSFLFIAILGLGIFFAVTKGNNLLVAGKDFNTSFNYEQFPLDIPVDNVEKILAYFDIHDEPSEVFIQLPGSSDFVIQGEPRLLRKIDYIAGR
jgi:Putative zinc-finger